MFQSYYLPHTHPQSKTGAMFHQSDQVLGDAGEGRYCLGADEGKSFTPSQARVLSRGPPLQSHGAEG